ncbi:serine/threonine-protein kinase Chk2 [Nematolebias whitei]|uniref:serine/threonine-protein kinase Chk2 n=1 Tax=Nematolebias whitei TaxID=451745 RepID=UPI001897DDFA|nr:serine/threonine-protein kinase Chk2 [Nematolebias whitei]
MSAETPPEGESSQSQAQSTLSPSQARSQSQPGSSSSSVPTSASQSSSGSGTLSSVDTIPVTLPSVPEEPEPQPWGRLLPMARGFRSLDCIEDQYLFGRDSGCQYVLDDPEEKGSKKFRIYSKKHFRIYRDGSEVFLKDYSNNGTYVDGVRVGLNKMLPLTNNAVLSLSEPRNRVFVFINLMSDSQSSLPEDLQNKYVLTRQIGAGVCGEVRLAFERSTCRKVAVKIINKKNFPSEGTATRNTEMELKILQKVDHPCLIKTDDFYQTEDSYYIVLELMEGGELFHRIKSRQQLKEDVAKLYFYQMLCAVQYLHGNGIIHRDLKPENILLASNEDDCLIKVTDFSLSRILEETSLMRTLCGTPSYLAPEVFTNASTTGYGLAADAWSLGVLLFVCLSGYAPFHENFSQRSVTEQIIRGEFTMVPAKWTHVSNQAKDMVRKLLVVEPTKRMTVDEALQHPWLQDQKMLEKAHRLMYPSGGDTAAPPTASPPSAPPMQGAESSGKVSRRKRGREENDEDHPAKRQAPPPAPPPAPQESA